MTEPLGDAMSETRRKGIGKRATTMSGTSPNRSLNRHRPRHLHVAHAKFLRRKCISGCIFAPHFGSDQGAARFAAVHKVFGASNVSKLLLHIPLNRRHEAIVTISYEAQARLSDPIYGCVSTILALQQQVASLQAELSTVQTQLINSRFAMANVLQQQHRHHHVAMLQPAYSNNSSASTNFINMSSFTSNFDLVADTAPSSHSMEPLQISQPSHDEEEDEEESQLPGVLFANEVLHRR
ncbi:LOB DOMAIN-CONTAINING PROTEIN 20 [Salix koriyanagi]|uniref:LOB DOMAIN-CONTAINING PROTEIN 20 n=1 Tax=Salix koriyanagi TaxID=2511006 RepID=A0A9Q1A464_9ROSI|nr:LOB DOMAIN-CONTAINING PROTEIN 20 [Salix koriyanagi]